MTLRNRHLFVVLSLLFLAPDLVFAFHLTLAAGALVSAGCVWAAGLFGVRGGGGADGVLGRAINLRALCLCLLVAFGLILLGGEGHIFYANSDWLIRDAVLADLSRSFTIPVYQIAGAQYVMRAPLGMYILPSLVGNIFGLITAHDVLAVQNSLILGILLYFLYEIPKQRKFTIVSLVLLFGGLDIIGQSLIILARHKTISLANIPSHIDFWSMVWQYSSNITQIFWVPNHALPGWWLAVLVMLCGAGEVTVGMVGLSIASTLFWSPLAAAGAIPFALALLIRRWKVTLGSLEFWLCAGASMTFLPIAAYLVAASGTIGHGFTLSAGNTAGAMAALMFVFLTLQIPQVFILIRTLPAQPPDRRILIVVAGVVLVALPFFNFGPSNDLVLRGSIPALLIVALVFSDTVINGMAGQPQLRGLALLVVVIGFFTPVFELARPLIFHRYAISDCTLSEAADELAPGGIATNYMVRTDAAPRWVFVPAPRGAPFRPRAGSCWPDYPFDLSIPIGVYSNGAILRSARRR